MVFLPLQKGPHLWRHHSSTNGRATIDALIRLLVVKECRVIMSRVHSVSMLCPQDDIAATRGLTRDAKRPIPSSISPKTYIVPRSKYPRPLNPYSPKPPNPKQLGWEKPPSPHSRTANSPSSFKAQSMSRPQAPHFEALQT